MNIRMTIHYPLAAALLLLASTFAQAANPCGELTNAYGPFDYRKRYTHHADNIRLVEMAHFPESVEQGIKGLSGTVGQALDYTLRAFPNHSRALAALARIAVKEKKLQLEGGRYPVECYFDRAIRFAPDDGAVRATYGTYLMARGQTEVAAGMFAAAVALDPQNATINYNLGLAQFKLKNYDKANLYAQKAYALGFPLPGLRKMLEAEGKWDPAAKLPEEAPAPDSAPAGTAAPDAAAAVPAPKTPEPIK